MPCICKTTPSIPLIRGRQRTFPPDKGARGVGGSHPTLFRYGTRPWRPCSMTRPMTNTLVNHASRSHPEDLTAWRSG